MIGLNDIINKFSSKYFGAAEVVLGENQQNTFYYTLFSRNKQSLVIVEKHKYEDFESFNKKVNKKIPCILTITGRGVIYKILAETNSGHDNPYDEKYLGHLLNQAIPGSKLKDFYLQTLEKEDKTFISVIRRSTLENLLAPFFDANIPLLTLNVGPTLFYIYNEKFQQKEIETNEYHFTNEKVFPAKNGDNDVNDYDILGEEVHKKYIISFLSGILYETGSAPMISLLPDSLTKAKEEFQYKLATRKVGIFSLGAVFLILIINFLIFSSLRNKYNNIQATYAASQSLLTQIDSLRTQIKQNDSIIRKSGIYTDNKTAYYIDRLSKTIPDEVRLTKMSINPVMKKNQDDKDLDIDYKSIVLNGSTSSTSSFNNWLKNVKKLKWVKDFSITNLKDNSDYKKYNDFQLNISIY